MIRYALACDRGHRFDSWFRDGAAYDDQAAAGFLSCPACGSPHVLKTIMAPAVVSGSAGTAGPAADVALAGDRSRETRALVRQFRARLIAEGRDVGDDFAAEARKIHDGVSADRQIYGRASIEDARDLLDDGIFVCPIPALPDDLN